MIIVTEKLIVTNRKFINEIMELDKKFSVEKKSLNSRTVKKCTPIIFSVTKCLLILFYFVWAVHVQLHC